MSLATVRPLAWGPRKGRWDGCEWNPEQDRGSEIGDRHFARTPAAYIVGPRSEGSVRYRLCADCAGLTLFKKRSRTAITKRSVARGRRRP